MGDGPEVKKDYLKTLSFGEEDESQESVYFLPSWLKVGNIATAENNKPLAQK